MRSTSTGSSQVWSGLLGFAALVAVGALGCGGGSKSDGSLAVSWRVGGQTCDSAGLEWVDVELLDFDGEVFDVTRARCAAGEVVFSSVRPGEYVVQILGYPRTKTADGAQLSRADATYEGEAAGLLVRSGQEARPASSIMLAARKGAVYLNWKFSNTMFCVYNGVAFIDVTFYDAYSNASEPTRYDCDLQSYRLTLPEEEATRPLRGVYVEKLDAEPLSVEVIGYDFDSNATHRGIQDFQVDHGEVRDLIVTLEPCAGACH